MFKKKILSVLSAAAVAASMAVGTGNTALALKDTGWRWDQRDSCTDQFNG